MDIKNNAIYVDDSLNDDDIYISRLISKLNYLNQSSEEKVDIALVTKSALYAKKHHGEQKRLSGEPYYSHPIEVAYLVSDYCFKTTIIVTSILHDVLEDTDVSLTTLIQDFGKEIASNVENLTKFKIDQKLDAQSMVELLYHHNNRDVLLIKLFDRLHNMQTIKFKPIEKQKKIALETLVIFLTLSIYLNLNDVEQQLYTLCSEILEQETDD
jgi:(p)ppGpp synthase/HD superfamily hydrolase